MTPTDRAPLLPLSTRLWILVVGAGAALLLLPAAADAAVGGLTQKSGTAGCISDTGTSGTCVDGRRLDNAEGIAIAPNGAHAYVVSGDSDALTIFDRNATTGALTQKAGTAGCISDSGSAGDCADGNALDGVTAVAVSPDGANVYVTADGASNDAVAIFDRNATTGALTQKAGTAGCVSEFGTGGTCANGTALEGASSITVAPDGENVYVASISSDSIAIFDRSTTTGALTQKTGTAGCISDTGTAGACVDGRSLDTAASVAITGDGRHVYAVARSDDALLHFDRNQTTGALTQKAGLPGCITETGGGGCTDGRALDPASAVAISPDDENVYVATGFSGNAIAIFDRSDTSGNLTQKSGTAGCISEDGTGGECADGKALENAGSIAVSPDGATVYTTAGLSNAVGVFDRDASTGALAQRSGTGGCISEDGSAGQCADGKALNIPTSVTVAPGTEGANVYTTAVNSDAIAVFDRDIRPQTQIDSGPSGPTADFTPTFTFSSSDAGSTFQCRIDSAAFAACSGSGTHTAGTTGNGPHTFQVRATDPAGNVDLTAASRSFSVDTNHPDTTIVSGPSGPTADSTPSFSFSSDEPDSTFQCRFDAAAFAACTGPLAVHTAATLPDGPHTFQVRAIDAAGNQDVSPPTRAFTVDTNPPETEILTGPSGTGTDDTPTFTFSSPEGGANFECRVDGAPFGPCSGGLEPEHTAEPLAEGGHTFEVRATDAAGNVDATPASRGFTVDLPEPPDTLAPQTTLTKTPKSKVRSKRAKAKVSFSFEASEAGSTFECSLDGAGFSLCSSPFAAKARKGRHTFAVRARDAAGNADRSAAEFAFTVKKKKRKKPR